MKVRDIVTFGILAGMMEAAKLGLAFLPNIELISLLVILFTLHYKEKVIYIIYTFVLVEGLLYGFGVWWIMYLYIWIILAGVTYLLRRNQSVLIWSMVAGIYGLLFGGLCALPYFFISGMHAGIAFWIAGIPYDITHGISNVIVTLLLFKPIHYLLKKVDYIIYK